MVAINFMDVVREGTVESDDRIELDVTARVVLTDSSGTVLFDWPYVPILELAAQLTAWLEHGCEHDADFVYESTEHASPLFRFQHSEDGWHLKGDVEGLSIETDLVLRKAAESFVKRVRSVTSAMVGDASSRILDPSRYRWRYSV
jgi:hypothetical protein